MCILLLTKARVDTDYHYSISKTVATNILP